MAGEVGEAPRGCCTCGRGAVRSHRGSVSCEAVGPAAMYTFCRNRSDHHNSLGVLCAVCLALFLGCSLTTCEHLSCAIVCHCFARPADASCSRIWHCLAIRHENHYTPTKLQRRGRTGVVIAPAAGRDWAPTCVDRIMCTMQAPLHAVRSWQQQHQWRSATQPCAWRRACNCRRPSRHRPPHCAGTGAKLTHMST